MSGVIGIVLGLAVAVGPLMWAAGPATSVSDAMVAAVSEASAHLLGAPGASEASSPTMILTLAAVVSVVTPGLVAVALVYAAKASRNVRSFVGALLVLGAAGSFLVLPGGSSVVLLVTAAVCAAALALLAGSLLSVVCWALATFMCVTNLTAIYNGSASTAEAAAVRLAQASHVSDPTLWRYTTLALAGAPFAAAVWFGLFGGSARRAQDPA